MRKTISSIAAFVLFLSGTGCATQQQVVAPPQPSHPRQTTDPMAAVKPFLDLHVHVDADGSVDFVQQVTAKIDGLLKDGRLQHAILISPSYRVNARSVATDGTLSLPPFHPILSMAARKTFDEQVQAVVAQHPDQLRGLCGYHPSWPDGDTIVQQCLAMPGMVGLKIRQDATTPSNSLEFEKQIRLTLQKNAANIKMVLWHLSSASFQSFAANLTSDKKSPAFASKLKLDLADLDAAVATAQQFPTIQFVFAHSLNGIPELMKRVTRLTKKAALNNVWIDEAWVLANSALQSADELAIGAYNQKYWQQLMTEWRRFGFNHILFGTDATLSALPPESPSNSQILVRPYGEAYPTELATIIENRFLTDREKTQVLIENGQDFWRKMTAETAR